MESISTSSVTIREEPARAVAYVRREGPYVGIPDAIQDLMNHLARNRLTPTGDPTAVFFTDPQTVPEAQAQWEVQMPVAAHDPDREPGADGVRIRTAAARTVAALIHTGPYDTVAPAYGHAAHWIDEHGYRVVGPPEEAYLSGPDTPPEKVRTEIRFPVAKAPAT